MLGEKKFEEKKKNLFKTILLILLLFLISGCIKPKINNQTLSDQNSLDNLDYNVSDYNQTNQQTQQDNIPYNCGNNVAEEGENCQNCPQDIKCAENEKCESGKCVIDTERELELEIMKCRLKSNNFEIDKCLYELAKNKGRYEACLRMQSKVNDCIIEIAKLVNNPNICYKTTNEEQKIYCINQVALKLRSEKVCLQQVNQIDRDKCIAEIANNRRDTNICEMIGASIIGGRYVKDDCYINIGNDTADCLKLSDKTRWLECIDRSKKSTIKREDCRNDNITYQNSCYYKHALLAKDPYACIEISDENKKQTCLIMLKEEINDENICWVFKNFELKEECYYRVAKYNKDFEICNSIVNDLLKYKCIIEIAKVNRDENICATIKNISYKDECYLQLAEYLENIETCEKVTSMQAYARCHAVIATIKQNYEICSELKSKENYNKEIVRDYCFYYYILKTLNYELCNKIIGIDIRKKANCQ